MNPWNDTSATVTERVELLLKELTLDEKVGQLGSFWPTPKLEGSAAGAVAPMESALRAGISWEEGIRHGLGHLTRIYGTEPVRCIEGIEQLRARQRQIVRQSRFGIPAIVHEECLTGFTTYGATVYPHP